VFKVDYVVEAIGNKEFGSIFLEANGQKENIALSVVSNGWAKVSTIRQEGCNAKLSCIFFVGCVPDDIGRS
jgi:hypothetical protein